MKKIYIFILLLATFSNSVFTQGFEKIYSFTNVNYMRDIIKTLDGGFLIVSSSRTYNNIYRQNLIRLDEAAFTKSIQIDSIYCGRYVMQFDDNSYYFVGSQYPIGYFTKTDSVFNIVWQDKQDNSPVGYVNNFCINKLNYNIPKNT